MDRPSELEPDIPAGHPADARGKRLEVGQARDRVLADLAFLEHFDPAPRSRHIFERNLEAVARNPASVDLRSGGKAARTSPLSLARGFGRTLAVGNGCGNGAAELGRNPLRYLGKAFRDACLRPVRDPRQTFCDDVTF